MKKHSPQGAFLKNFFIILAILSGLTVLSFLTFAVYTYLEKDIPAEAIPHIHINADDISTNIQIKQTNSLASLQILPDTYDSLVKDFGDFSPHELTTYLRYSEVLKASNLQSVTEGYKYIQEKNLPLLIPQEYIDQYFLSQISDISKQVIQDNPSQSEYVTIGNDSTSLKNLQECIFKNVDLFFSNTSCQDELKKLAPEGIAPTLESLINNLATISSNSQNDYDKYINNQKYIYQLTKRKQISDSKIPTTQANADAYLEINQKQLQQISSIIKYLKLAYTQLQLKDSTLNSEINALENAVNQLEQYEYGNNIPPEIMSVINSSYINIENTEGFTNITKDSTVSFLIKSININNETKTFVAPIYTFTGTNSPTSLSFEINDNNFNEDYDVTPASQSKGTVRVPIFMYHQIDTVPQNNNKFQTGLYVDPHDFEVEMAYLVKKNYRSITPLEYYNLLKTGVNPTQKTVMLTFDDGIENQYLNAYPVLKKYHLTGVFYVVAHKSSITLSQRREMANNGMIVDSHSSTHIDLTKVTDPTQLSYEIASSKASLQATTGKTIYSFAYPGCGWNSETLSYVSGAGYILGMSCGNTIDNRFSYKLVLSRVHAFGDLDSFEKLLSGKH